MATAMLSGNSEGAVVVEHRPRGANDEAARIG
ncbi:hypothetical protein CVS53_02888 [Microbacterium oxydans]|nr:hypothetical protein CVS53_02888 [Microbacterium oxydans]